MKILFINDYLQKVGGTEKIIYDTKHLLENRGHEVKILGSQKSYTNSFWKSCFSGWFNIYFFYKTKKLINQFSPEIVHIHGIHKILSPSVLFAARISNVPTVATIHDFYTICPKEWMIFQDKHECKYGFGWRCLVSDCYPHLKESKIFFWLKRPYHWLKWVKLAIYRKIIRTYVDCFISPSMPLNIWVAKSLKTDKNIYLPNFVEINEKTKINSTQINPCQFLFVGRLTKEKGAHIAIRAIETLAKKDRLKKIQLIIIGDGPERNSLEHLVQTRQLTQNIKFLGKVDHRKLHYYYQRSLAVLMPSICMENNPLVALEAMKYSKPIIASNTGGLADLIEHNKTGYLFRRENSLQMAKYIKKMYNNIKLSQKMGAAGFGKLEEKFSQKAYYKKLIKIYSQVINEY